MAEMSLLLSDVTSLSRPGRGDEEALREVVDDKSEMWESGIVLRVVVSPGNLDPGTPDGDVTIAVIAGLFS